MMALVWTRNELTRLRYRLGDVAERRAAIHAEIEKLEIEVAALGSPRRIEARAVALGLRYPQPGQVIHLDERGPAEAQVAAAPRAVVAR
jgi:cell division protein FtsL